jgi:predicted permease
MSDVIGAMVRRVRHLLGRRRFDADLAEEMDFHRAMRERELTDDGADPRDAALRARRVFGSSALAHDQARDVWVWPWLEDLGRDVRFAVRLLGKDRAFTTLVALVLGLGIGVANMQAVLVNAICVRGLPIPTADRVAYIAAHDARDREQPLSYREFETISTTPALAEAAAFSTARVVVGDEGLAPDRAIGVYISPAAFHIVGAAPALGRAFEAADDRPGAAPVAILAEAFWMSRYAGDRAVVGRTVLINGVPTAIVGVMTGDFRFPSTTDLWQPLAMMPGLTTTGRAARALTGIGRLADGRSFADLGGQLGAEAAQFTHDYRATNADMRITAVPINTRYNGRITDSVWIAFMSVGVIVLLVACANTANLLLMRSAARGHEMAVRASLGASRARLVRQLLVESAALAALGGLVGVALSLASVRAIASITPPNTLAYWITFTMDSRLLAWLCTVCLGTVFVFGLAPALHVSRVDVASVAKEGGRGASAGARARRWTTGFLIAEFGLTMVMVAALVLGWRQTRDAARRDIVIAPERLVTAGLTLSPARYGSTQQRQAFYDEIAERVSADPDVSSFAFTSNLPSAGAAPRQTAIDGRDPAPGEQPPTSWALSISEDYFDVVGLRLFAGRSFNPRDGLPGNDTAIVNRRFADTFFAGADPIGHRVKLTDPNAPGAAAWLTVVGVSPTVRQRPFPDPDPIVYLPIRAAPPAGTLIVVRAKSDVARIGARLREAVAAVDPNMPLDHVMSMEQALALAQWNGRVSTDILNGIGIVALCLIAIGVYAVASYGVSQRTQEIGVRIALGASRSHVIVIVMRRAAAQLGWGLLAGIVCTVAWSRLIGGSGERYLDSDSVSGPINLLIVAMIIGVIVLLASIVPARRAARLDPLVALRHE